MNLWLRGLEFKVASLKRMVFRPGPFKEPLKGEVQGFKGSTEVWSRLNRDDVIINLIIK